ncbi:minor capsid protein [Capybara microvirus Cap1_SP_145]|nr:minor capsid protein [Capybara microvirus Cap1_SP_145]
MPISPYIGLASTLLGGGLNALSTASSNRQSFKYSKKLAEFQNDLQLQNWNLENQYNLPVNQLQRLKSAGINPALAYSNGNLQNTASDLQAPSISQFNNKPIDMSFLGNAINQSLQLQSQLRLQGAQTKELETRSDENEAKIVETLTRSGMNEKQALYIAQLQSESEQKIKNMEQEFINLKQTLDNLKSQKRLTDYQANIASVNLANMQELINYEKDYKLWSINNLKQNMTESQSRIAYNYASVGLINQQIKGQYFQNRILAWESSDTALTLKYNIDKMNFLKTAGETKIVWKECKYYTEKLEKELEHINSLIGLNKQQTKAVWPKMFSNFLIGIGNIGVAAGLLRFGTAAASSTPFIAIPSLIPGGVTRPLQSNNIY